MHSRRSLLTAFLLLTIVGMDGRASARQSSTRAVAPRSDEIAREKWQRVDEIFDRLRIGAGSVVADLGAGGGFFTARLSEAVGPSGHVYAVDVSDQAVRGLKGRVERDDLKNVDVVLSAQADPKLPAAALDAVLIVNAYHEMRSHQEVLDGIRKALKPGGRLVLVEPTAKDRPKATRDEQARAHIIAIELALEDLQAANFQVIERQEDFVNRPNDESEWVIVAEPK